MHPIVVPAVLTGGSRVPLGFAAVHQQRLPRAQQHPVIPLLNQPRAQQHPVIPLLNQPRAAQGVEEQVALLVRAGGRKMPLRQILPRLGAYIRLPHRGRARRRPQPDTFRQDIHRVGQHVHPPHALLSILYTKFRLISMGSAFFAK